MECLENSKFGCVHVILVDGKLTVWNIKHIRQEIMRFDDVRFVTEPALRFSKGGDIPTDPRILHFISNPIKKSQSTI
jgi:hypothetical protein